MGVEIILGLADDQLSNQFQLVFPSGIPGGGNGDLVALRMDQQFDAPEQTTNEYTINYKGMTVMKAGMLDETDKHFSIAVRIDQQWEVFDSIMKWKQMVHNPINGTRLPFALVNTTVLVQSLDGQNNIVKTIKFGGVLIKGVKVETFDHASTDPSRMTLNFMFSTLAYE